MHAPRDLQRCPKTGRVIQPRRGHWAVALLFVGGALATLWYVLRVFPKPSRASYPCQSATAPLRWAWLASVGLSSVAASSLLWARWLLRRSRYVLGAAALVGFAVGVAGLITHRAKPAAAAFVGCESAAGLANQPIGIARGVHPGRVVWVHDPAVSEIGGPLPATISRQQMSLFAMP
jgi:hypothetical protein